jgi:hypothetical protein
MFVTDKKTWLAVFSVVDPNSFFRIRIHNFCSDSGPNTNILSQNFVKWCLLLLS